MWNGLQPYTNVRVKETVRKKGSKETKSKLTKLAATRCVSITGNCFSARIKAEHPPCDEEKGLSALTEGEILLSTNLKNFSFIELRIAIRNFRPDSVVGEDGFGYVFKGWMDEHTLEPTKPNTKLVITVKRLNQGSTQGHSEWLTEINYLGQLDHPNLVKLIGYSLEDDHRILVYEFFTKGNLDNHLFGRASYVRPLSWNIRMNITLDVAKGLVFLHIDQLDVIYRDFKTSNILHDSSYHAKLSDFGLAKDGPVGDKSHVPTRIMGTFGYAATALISTDSQYPLHDAIKVAALAIKCLPAEPKFRPTMDEVVRSLEQLKDSQDTITSGVEKSQHQTVKTNGNSARSSRISSKQHRRSNNESLNGEGSFLVAV
ncbi:hypothetical protein AHAS_Ahas06G0197200 [Arachis hypogaea]